VGRYIKKGGHGGARSNAGRRSLSKLDRLLIGAKAEELAHIFEHLPNPRLPCDEIQQSQKLLQRVPLKERNKLSDEATEHLDWLTETLHRRRVGRGERPKLDDIFAGLAEKETRERGISITARTIRRWRDQYLATKKPSKE
jgi:hypothetical protein